MRFSLDWLRDFVDVDLPPSDLADRLTTGGFEVGSWETVGPPDGAPDIVFEIDITANRPDAMNHLGLAREIAALLDLPLKSPSFSLVESAPPASEAAQVVIEAPDLCPSYIGRVVVDARAGESPAWLKTRLSAIGLAPKNAIVDASNYVLFELGQPLHAFDLDRLSGRGVRIRRSRAGEKIVTVVDREERALPEGLLVIAEAGEAQSGPVAAIAGVMGGFNTAISDATRSVLIESAWFDPGSVRRAARALGLHTDASHRFERGADPGMTRFAADRLAAMIAELTGGRVLEGVVGGDTASGPPTSAPSGTVEPPTTADPSSAGGERSERLEVHHRQEPILLRTDQLSALLGIEAEASKVRSVLERLGIESFDPHQSHLPIAGSSPSGSGGKPAQGVPGPRADGDRASKGAARRAPNTEGASSAAKALSFLVPTWRGDLSREEDLIEEYARLTGYDAIPETLPRIDAPPPRTQRGSHEDRVRARLASFGYREAISYAMISRGDDAMFGSLATYGIAPPTGRSKASEPGPEPKRVTENVDKERAVTSGLAPQEQDHGFSAPLVITNPLSDRWEVMRRSLLPGMARALTYNQARGRTDLRLFEVGTLHYRDASGGVRETLAAAIGGCGLGEEPAWPSSPRPYDVLDLKGAAESLVADLVGINLREDRLAFIPLPEPPGPNVVFHSRQSFAVLLDGTVIGRGGRLHSDIEHAIEADRPLHVAEISLEPFLDEHAPVRFEPIPRLNPVERDLSFLVSRDVPFATIEREVRLAVRSIGQAPESVAAPKNEVRDTAPVPSSTPGSVHASGPRFVLIDRFEGGSLPSGKVSYAFRFRFSPRERALTTEELNASIETIAAHLTKALDAEIRSSR